MTEVNGSLERHNMRNRLEPNSSLISPQVTFVGPVQAVNGLGVSARGYVNALSASGARVHIEPWTYGFEAVNSQPAEFGAPDRGDINIIHLNLDLLSNEGGLLDRPPLADLMGSGCYNILIPYWELASLRPEWLPILSRFDEVWCASRFMQRAFSAVSRTPVLLLRPMLTLATPKRTATTQQTGWLTTDSFSFFYSADMGSTFNRKNPELFWRAYCKEFKESEGAACVLKLHYAKTNHPSVQALKSIAEGRKDMHLMLESVSADEMAALWESIGCYVSPHRSEGLGLTVIEAMLAGKPVIATPYGGTGDFVSDETAFTIQYSLAEIGPGDEPYPKGFVWSEPDYNSLRQRMREVFLERTNSKIIANVGQELVKRIFGADSASEIRVALDRIAVGKYSDLARQQS